MTRKGPIMFTYNVLLNTIKTTSRFLIKYKIIFKSNIKMKFTFLNDIVSILKKNQLHN